MIETMAKDRRLRGGATFSFRPARSGAQRHGADTRWTFSRIRELCNQFCSIARTLDMQRVIRGVRE